jgi:circadian clock protein KaiC
MTRSGKAPIPGLPSGVPGFDDLLGGQGLPEYSFNLIAGPPGSGKTTFAQQIMFTNATVERPALFFTVLGEPTLKMMRYMQQLSFFDEDKVGNAIRFVNLSDAALAQDLDAVLQQIVAEVDRVEPSILVVDSFRTVLRAAQPTTQSIDVEGFVQRLAQHLTSWQATTFLVGEYARDEMRDNPVFTVADSLIWLWQSAERNAVVRKLQVGKMRGRAPTPGHHTFRITDDGVRIFPRRSNDQPKAHPRRSATEGPRRRFGIAGVDEMANGGIPSGSAVLAAGPAGSGKSLLAQHFAAAGLDAGERVVMALFEEHPEEYLWRADSLGLRLSERRAEGALEVIYARPLDLSVDETLYNIQQEVDRGDATRVIIDSLSGLEVAVAPSFQDEYRESVYRLVGQLTRQGITVFMTCEVVESFADLKFTPHAISFLTDVIIVQRYIELEGRLQKMMSIVKMRNSAHSNELRQYKIGPHGIEMGETLSHYRGIVTGVPQALEAERAAHPGLNLHELLVLQALIAFGPATVQVLCERVGLSDSDVQAAIARLLSMHYAEAGRDGDGNQVYGIGKLA